MKQAHKHLIIERRKKPASRRHTLKANSFIYAKSNYLIFIVFIAVILYSCTGEDVKLHYEPGIYKPYKQDISPIYAFTDNKEIDGSSIKVTDDFPDKIGDIHFVDMEPTTDPLRETHVQWSSIHLEKNTAFINCPTCLNKPMHLCVKNDSLFMTPKNPGPTVKFAPYSEVGLIVADEEEVERHATLRCKLIESGFIVSSYTIFVKSPRFTRGITDAYYLDIDYLRNELKENDTLVYVKKETYFRK